MSRESDWWEGTQVRWVRGERQLVLDDLAWFWSQVAQAAMCWEWKHWTGPHEWTLICHEAEAYKPGDGTVERP